MSCRMHCSGGFCWRASEPLVVTLVLVFISSYCAFCARNVYVRASRSPSQLWLGYWTNTKRRCKLHNKLASFHPCIHASLPFLTCKRLVGSIKQRTTSPRKNLLFFCLTSLFANLLARIPSVCHAAQICKPPSQSKKYLRPPLSERIFLLSRKFVRHFSTLYCLLQRFANLQTP